MSETNTVATLNGLFKEVYANKLETLIPDGVKLLNRIGFEAGEKALGNYFHAPVNLAYEHGVTFNDGDGTAFTLNAAVAGQTKDAQVRGNELVLRSNLSYAAASRSMKGGNRAFMDGTKFLVSNMVRSMAKKLEAEMFYGQVGYGTVAAVSGSGNVTFSIPAAQYASGLWSGAEGMPIEIRNAAGTVSRGNFTVVTADIEARTVTTASDLTAAGVIATDVVWHKGAYGKEFAGLHKILTNTSSIFGIDASQYSLWKSSSVSAASGVLSFAKINSAIAAGVAKGLESDVSLFVSPKTWSNLLSDQAALRKYDASYKPSETETGSKSLKFHAQNGAIEIVPSIYCKEGFAYIIPQDDYSRIGSTDVTFKRPGQGDDFFRDLTDAAGYELRAMTDQALFCKAPGRSIIITDIINT